MNNRKIIALGGYSRRRQSVVVETVIIQPDSTAGYDTMIIDTAPTQNNSALDNVQIGKSIISGTYYGLMKFDLSSIPSSAIILQAQIETTLVLNATDRASGTGLLLPQFLLRNWVLSQATYNVWKTGSNWQSPGAAGGNDAEVESMGVGEYHITEVIGNKNTIILTPSRVQRRTSGALANYGMRLAMNPGDGTAYRIASSRHATASYRPKLTIKYTTVDPSLLRQITFSGDSKSNNNDSWPSLLLDALYAATGTPFYENPQRLAVSGYTAAQLHTYVDANIGALTGSPEAVLLNIGANDLTAGTTEATFKAALTGIIDAYRGKFATSPVYVAYPWCTGYDASALTMKGWIDAVIATYGSGVLAGHNENVWFKPNVATLSYDGTHYNDAGAVACKNQWMTVLGH